MEIKPKYNPRKLMEMAIEAMRRISAAGARNSTSGAPGVGVSGSDPSAPRRDCFAAASTASGRTVSKPRKWTLG